MESGGLHYHFSVGQPHIQVFVILMVQVLPSAMSEEHAKAVEAVEALQYFMLAAIEYVCDRVCNRVSSLRRSNKPQIEDF